MNAPFRPETAEERAEIGRRALESEFARRRKLNNIPDTHLTPMWLEQAIARDWTLIDGKPSEVRARAERAERRRIA